MFKKNLEAINKSNHDLTKRLNTISIEDAKKSIEVYQAQSGDVIISYNNVMLDNATNPIEDSNINWQNNVQEQLLNTDIIIIFGLGLGYLFKRAYISCPCKILIYEPNLEVLRFVLEYVDLSEQLSDTRVFLTNDENDFSNYLTEKYITNDKIKFIYPPGYLNINSKEIISISDIILNICNSKNADINTISKLSKLWVKNNINNIKFMDNSRPLSILKNEFKDLTALILAAGPSLKSNIDTIKQNRDKYIIFAVNRSLDYLIQNDVIPDFLVVADARYVEYTIKELGKASSKINLITTTKADSCIYNYKFNSIFNYYLKNDVFNEEVNKIFPKEIELYQTEGTAVSQCYYSAIEMGFSKIVFCGLDLALKEKVAYADGEEVLILSETQTLISSDQRKLVQVKSVTGDLITTRDDYELFIKQLEKAFSKDKAPVLYNTTDFGAYLEGMIYEPLEKISKQLPEINIDITKKISEKYSITQDIWEKILETQKNMIFSQKENILNIKTQIESWLKQNKSIIEAIASSTPKENTLILLNNIQKAELSIIKEILNSMILGSYFQSEILKYTELSKDNGLNIETDIKARKYSLEMFEQILPEIEELLDKLN